MMPRRSISTVIGAMRCGLYDVDHARLLVEQHGERSGCSGARTAPPAPPTRARPWRCRARRSRRPCASDRAPRAAAAPPAHGTHQVAQKSSSTTLPPKSERCTCSPVEIAEREVARRRAAAPSTAWPPIPPSTRSHRRARLQRRDDAGRRASLGQERVEDGLDRRRRQRVDLHVVDAASSTCARPCRPGTP